MNRSLGWVVGFFGMLVATSCGARDQSSADLPDASTSAPSYASTPEQQVRASYVSARQAESATDPAYAFHRTGSGMETVHPDSQLRAHVDRDGVTLSRAGEAWSANLQTTRIGCKGTIGPHVSSLADPWSTPGDPHEATNHQNRVHVEKSAGSQHFTEWYVQGALGLEQGWTLREDLCATGQLDIGVKVAGLTVADGKDGLELRDAAGHDTIHYTDASAHDAKGRSLETTMSATSGAIVIHVDTRGAAFPVEVDPLAWFQLQELTTSNGASGDAFGWSVAVSGGTAVVGAHDKTVGANTNQGAAYVFVQSGTTWTLQQTLTPSDGAANDFFGDSVAVSGGTAVVGSSYKTVGANTAQGAAYVFVQNGTTWSEQQKLIASDGAANDRFAVSVAVSGGTAVVGASERSIAGPYTYEGTAYVFVRSGTTWTQTQKLIGQDNASFDHFGSSVAVSGGVALVGAPYKNVGAGSQQGAVYVFNQSGTTWTQQQRLTASDAADSDEFGISLALSPTTAIIGAARKVVGLNFTQGAAYVFVQSGTTWTEQQRLTASDGASLDYFGISVALAGSTVVVGARNKTINTISNQGAAYVFLQSGTTWTQQQRLTAADGAASDLFGASVAISGTTALVGAYDKKVGTNTNQGAVYVFNDLPASGTPCTKPSDCGSGFCVDGVCCDTACTGLCQACAASVKQTGKDDGTCGFALNGQNPHKDACPVDLPSTCKRDGQCDGKGACRAYAGVGTVCTSTCTADTETNDTCDGNGACTAGTPKSCGKYRCDGTRCKTACTTAPDCVTGFACQAGVCVPGAACVGNESQSADGRIVNCAPYRCDTSGPASGTCKSTCNSVDDCSSPAVCDPSGKCVVAPAASNSGGCSTSSGNGTTAGIGTFLLMAAITRLRRRSRTNRKMS